MPSLNCKLIIFLYALHLSFECFIVRILKWGTAFVREVGGNGERNGKRNEKLRTHFQNSISSWLYVPIDRVNKWSLFRWMAFDVNVCCVEAELKFGKYSKPFITIYWQNECHVGKFKCQTKRNANQLSGIFQVECCLWKLCKVKCSGCNNNSSTRSSSMQSPFWFEQIP